MKRVAAVAVAVAFFLPVFAWGGSLVPTLALDVTSDQNQLHLTPALVAGAPGSFTSHVDESAASFSIVADLALNADPGLSGSFLLTNLSGITQTFTLTATLSGLSAIPAPTTVQGFVGETTYSDADLSGSVRFASPLFYQARIDGAGVMSLGSFDQTASGGAGISGTVAFMDFGPTGGGPAIASSIAVAFPGFSLTAGDSVEVPFQFQVDKAVPEPGFASLFAAGALIFVAAAARRRTV